MAVRQRRRGQDSKELAELLEEVLVFTRQMGNMLGQLADDLERLAVYPPELRRGADGFAVRAAMIERLLADVRAAPRTR